MNRPVMVRMVHATNSPPVLVGGFTWRASLKRNLPNAIMIDYNDYSEFSEVQCRIKILEAPVHSEK